MLHAIASMMSSHKYLFSHSSSTQLGGLALAGNVANYMIFYDPDRIGSFDYGRSWGRILNKVLGLHSGQAIPPCAFGMMYRLLVSHKRFA
jgi:hypothetical protein